MNDPISTKRPDLLIFNMEKKRNYHLADFPISRDQIENKRKWKDRQVLGPCQKTKKQQLWNMRMKIIPIGIGVLGMVSKRLAKKTGEIRRIKTIQIVALLRSARILRKPTCCYSDFSVKKLPRNYIMIDEKNLIEKNWNLVSYTAFTSEKRMILKRNIDICTCGCRFISSIYSYT